MSNPNNELEKRINELDEEAAVYVISVAAELSGLHPQTLRQYDRLGLVSPGRTSGRNRRYSLRDIALLRTIQSLVAEGINHYQSLRETLHKMAGKKGYNNYFESWTPSLMEDEVTEDLTDMFKSSSLDPRIESVMPILSKLSKNVTEDIQMTEVAELEEWADNLMTLEDTSKEEDEDTQVETPTIIRRGMKGDIVKDIQTALKLTADGIFGPGTEAAVKKFQADHSLTADGVVGPMTLEKLLG